MNDDLKEKIALTFGGLWIAGFFVLMSIIG